MRTAAKGWWARLADYVFGGKSSEPATTKGRRSRPQPFRSRLLLEPLEDRLAPAQITWTGASGVDSNWSTAKNWAPKTVPTATDDVIFNAMNNNFSVVDAFFGGTVKTLTIEKGFTNIISLERSLTSTTAEQNDGTISGSGTFIVPTGGTFNWLGGKQKGLGGPAYRTIIENVATLNIADNADKTLDGRTINNSGRINWLDAGDLILTNEAVVDNLSGATFTAGQGAATTL